jgi:N-acetylmuramoyl-L-alanine amidase
MQAPLPRVFRQAWRWVILALGLAPCVCGATLPVSKAPVAAGVSLMGVRFGGDGVSTRVVLDLDAAVSAGVIRGEGGADHLSLRLPALRAPQPTGGRGRGLVNAWSLRDDGQGARLDLALAAGATAERRFLIPPSPGGGPWRYVIDIKDPDPLSALAAEFPAGPSTPAPAPAPAPPHALSTPASALADLAPKPPDGLLAPSHGAAPHLLARSAVSRTAPSWRPKVIVVDAGHGGHDPGARSLVRNEKDITLAAALSLKARLEQMGRYKVVLTRDSDVFIPLEDRVRIARRAGADLFISLHADSAGADPTPHGASVYTLSDHGQTRVKTVLGPHEWFTHLGSASAEPAVSRILLDLTQRSTLNRSSQFASLLVNHIAGQVDLLPRTHRDASYFVLLAPDVPAVLLEMGFITNPVDEMRLTDPAQRDTLMSRVADTIDTFFHGDSSLAAG